MASFIISGAPGAGKTSVLTFLAARGHDVISEAASDVIAEQQACGIARPWEAPDFITRILSLQLARQRDAPDQALHDRSVICTLALCRFLGQTEPPALLQACAVAGEQFAPGVFFVRLLGFITPTDARQISYAESQRFERFHEAAYREFGFRLIDVPAGPVAERADVILRAIGIGPV